MTFTHLHVTTSYSLLTSSCKIEDLVHKAVDLGLNSLAITDRNVMYGVIPFYKACKKNGIKPIIGLTLSVTSIVGDVDKSYPLVLLAKNNHGYRNLIQLTSLYQTDFPSGVPFALLHEFKENLIAISPFKGEVGHLLLTNRKEDAKTASIQFKDMFKTDYYLGVERHGLPHEEKVNEVLEEFSSEISIKLVATNDVQYIERKDSLAHQCLIAIKHGVKIKEKNEDTLLTEEYYLKSTTEMQELYSNHQDALLNTVQIANQCNVSFEFGKRILPEFPTPVPYTADSYLETLCQKGLKERYEKVTRELLDRLRYELETIQKMNFSDYFLIVWDFMRFSHEKGILTGPGRGSAAGSLVSYVLKITNVDPIEHGLLFERFLNPERVSMPDIDIDFSDIHRDRVIQYVTQKYGKDRVAQIITFGTLAARAAIRDIGRVMGLELDKVDRLAKLIPGRIGITLKEAYNESSALREMLEESDETKKVFIIAQTVEGLPRHTSIHAAGIVISRDPLTNDVPVQAGNDGVRITQYTMDILELKGLLKMDFLGLRNLTLIENISGMIKKNQNQAFQLHQIPYNDSKTFELLSMGDTAGVFQLESEGMRRVLQQLKPTHFEDIVAVNALYRPGPMEHIPVYIDRKHGRKRISYPHPVTEDILKKTYGVIVYQEQIMQIASKLAGFSLGEADILRRAVSKKDSAVLQKERRHFVEGAIKNGYNENTATEIYDLIVKFANYGFNRSHAVAYSVIAYELAYLKANYPIYFLASLLTNVIGNDDKIAEYIREAKRKGIAVLSPSINKSMVGFSVEGNGIRYSLAAIKNVGASVLRDILKERKKRPFTDLFDFCIRISLRIVNRRVIEALINSGSFDEFGINRASLLASLDVAIEHAELIRGDQDGLFLDEDLVPKPQYIRVEEFNTLDLLRLEKEAIGFFLSTHPVEPYRKVLETNKIRTIKDLYHLPSKSSTSIGCFVFEYKVIKTKKGDQMAFLKVGDETAEMDCVVFPSSFTQASVIIQKEKLLYIKGSMDSRNGSKQFILEELLPLRVVIKEIRKTLFIKIDEGHENAGNLNEIKKVLRKNRGMVQVVLYYSKKQKTVKLTPDWNVNPTEAVIKELKKLLGEQNIVLKED